MGGSAAVSRPGAGGSPVALTLSLGILFLAGLAAVILAERLGVPRVTLYIVVGLLIGPSLLNWIPHEHLEEFDPVLKLALAMVLLEIGSRFTFASFGQIMPAAVRLSIGELAVTLSLVTLGVWAVSDDWSSRFCSGAWRSQRRPRPRLSCFVTTTPKVRSPR